MPHFSQVLIFSLIPAFAMALGGFISSYRIPSPKFTNAMQHLAAGIVFAAVAIELLPIVLQSTRLNVTIGFLLGVMSMLWIKVITMRMEAASPNSASLPAALLFAVGIDLFIDGLLIGITFLASYATGLLISLALSSEIFFLGLSTIATLTQKQISFQKKLWLTILFSVLIIIGALLGFYVVGNLPRTWIDEVISFGIAALLYLVIEELMVEAHEVEDTPWTTGMFFVGFLFILLFRIH